jgi:PAS domain S-box-containing protein
MTTSVEKNKILIVDDSPSNLYTFQTVLGAPHLEIMTANSGEEALQTLLEHQDTALILMDVNMPDMDGFETTELIRGQPRFRDIPILFITAVHKSDEFARHGFDVGAFDYITKPVDGEVLESKVNVFLTLQKQKRQLAHEIAERVQAEEALRESEREKAVILDSVSELVSYQDSELRIIWANRAAAESVGLSVAELVGQHCYEIWPQRSEPCVGCPVAKAIETGAPQEAEMTTPDGRVWSIKGYPVWGENGDIISAVEVTLDITERQRAEEAMQEYAERLEDMVEERTRELREAQEELVRKEKLAVLGQLAGGVAHELRNPLGAINNSVYFVKLALEEPDPEVKEALGIVEKEVWTCDRIIRSLLDFARTRAPHRQRVAVNQIVEAALGRVSVPERVEVARQLDEELPVILADPDQLAQVFDNIIRNAVQAMPHGGRLVIKTWQVFPEPARSGQIAVSFTDTGGGIPEENLEKIFDPLFTTKAKGIGLGLPLAKNLVEGHGGSIEVSSEVGVGSTFTVRLPLDGVTTGS